VRAFGHLLIAVGATVSLYGLASWAYAGDSTPLTAGVTVMVAGFVLPRVVRNG